MKKSYDRTAIVIIHEEQCYGMVEQLGAFASIVKYVKNGVEIEEILDNADFTIVDEIVFEHEEEE